MAAVFLVLILGLPLSNAVWPEAMNDPWVGGFTPTWLFLGVLVLPDHHGLSFYFVAASDRIEADCVGLASAPSTRRKPDDLTSSVS